MCIITIPMEPTTEVGLMTISSAALASPYAALAAVSFTMAITYLDLAALRMAAAVANMPVASPPPLLMSNTMFAI